jgi:hypothetical protein
MELARAARLTVSAPYFYHPLPSDASTAQSTPSNRSIRPWRLPAAAAVVASPSRFVVVTDRDALRLRRQ